MLFPFRVRCGLSFAAARRGRRLQRNASRSVVAQGRRFARLKEPSFRFEKAESIESSVKGSGFFAFVQIFRKNDSETFGAL